MNYRHPRSSTLAAASQRRGKRRRVLRMVASSVGANSRFSNFAAIAPMSSSLISLRTLSLSPWPLMIVQG